MRTVIDSLKCGFLREVMRPRRYKMSVTAQVDKLQRAAQQYIADGEGECALQLCVIAQALLDLALPLRTRTRWGTFASAEERADALEYLLSSALDDALYAVFGDTPGLSRIARDIRAEAHYLASLSERARVPRRLSPRRSKTVTAHADSTKALKVA